jgi:hypothetical protein
MTFSQKNASVSSFVLMNSTSEDMIITLLHSNELRVDLTRIVVGFLIAVSAGPVRAQ